MSRASRDTTASAGPAGWRRRLVVLALCGAAVVNAGAVLWLWLHGGGAGLLTHSAGGLLTSLGRLTALLGTYLVLIQVLLLSRLPWLERLLGFDRLTVWHRRNALVAIALVVAHVPLTFAGRALLAGSPVGREIAASTARGQAWSPPPSAPRSSCGSSSAR